LSKFESLSKAKVPLLYFVPLRILTGLSWVVWGALYLAAYGIWAVVALIAGGLLITGLLTRLGAFLGVSLSYIGYFSASYSKIANIAPPYSPLVYASWPLFFAGLALLFWNTGRVLGLDSYLVEKAPFFAKIYLA